MVVIGLLYGIGAGVLPAGVHRADPADRAGGRDPVGPGAGRHQPRAGVVRQPGDRDRADLRRRRRRGVRPRRRHLRRLGVMLSRVRARDRGGEHVRTRCWPSSRRAGPRSGPGPGSGRRSRRSPPPCWSRSRRSSCWGRRCPARSTAPRRCSGSPARSGAPAPSSARWPADGGARVARCSPACWSPFAWPAQIALFAFGPPRSSCTP